MEILMVMPAQLFLQEREQKKIIGGQVWTIWGVCKEVLVEQEGDGAI